MLFFGQPGEASDFEQISKMSDQRSHNRIDQGDRQVRRTNQAITVAFSRLLIERGWEGMSIGEIAERADVARSTFYQHFASKEALLCTVTRPILLPLADTTSDPATPIHLTMTLGHLWENRQLGRELFSGTARRFLINMLGELIAERLTSRREPSVLPPRLLAVQIAQGQIGMLEEWLTAKHHCPPAVLATGIAEVSRAMVCANSAASR